MTPISPVRGDLLQDNDLYLLSQHKGMKLMESKS